MVWRHKLETTDKEWLGMSQTRISLLGLTGPDTDSISIESISRPASPETYQVGIPIITWAGTDWLAALYSAQGLEVILAQIGARGYFSPYPINCPSHPNGFRPGCSGEGTESGWSAFWVQPTHWFARSPPAPNWKSVTCTNIFPGACSGVERCRHGTSVTLPGQHI